jgi:hypothetical protein
MGKRVQSKQLLSSTGTTMPVPAVMGAIPVPAAVGAIDDIVTPSVLGEGGSDSISACFTSPVAMGEASSGVRGEGFDISDTKLSIVLGMCVLGRGEMSK